VLRVAAALEAASEHRSRGRRRGRRRARDGDAAPPVTGFRSRHGAGRPRALSEGRAVRAGRRTWAGRRDRP
jgi:hypothetical protein